MKRLLFLVLLSILPLHINGCSQIQNNTDNNNKPPLSMVTQSSEITSADISEGKQVIQEYFNALKNSRYDDLQKTLGRYKQGLYNKENIDKWKPDLDSIEYPGNYIDLNTPPSSYISIYKKAPYKFMTLHVIFTEELKKKDWDYILVKEEEKSSWVIHDWGK